MAGLSQERRSSVPDPQQFGFETYLSPKTFRYGSKEMREIWSQRRFWGAVRDVWIAAGETQHGVGLVTRGQLDNLRSNRDDLSVERIFELERQTGHDVAGSIAEFSEIAPVGGEILHQGMTSEDVLSNAEIMQIHEALGIVRQKLVGTLSVFGSQIDRHKNLVCMGYTHLQAAEPTTMGYRLAKYAQDLLIDLKLLDVVRPMIKGKGIKGAVGTSASFAEILEGTGIDPQEHERRIMERLGIEPVTVSDQTYPRKSLFLTEIMLSSIGQSLHRFALDLQILQSSPIDEVSEPRRRGQIGSSAMPHKQNPINSENIDALTEELPGELFAAWMTGAFVTLERTLRDSAGKRSWLPESFLIIDEVLARAERVVRGLVIHENSIKTNLELYAPFCVTEIILADLVKAGMDRKEAHEVLVEHAESAIEAKRSGLPNPMKELVIGDQRIVSLLGEDRIIQAFEKIFRHVGDAPERCDRFLREELYPAIGN